MAEAEAPKAAVVAEAREVDTFRKETRPVEALSEPQFTVAKLTFRQSDQQLLPPKCLRVGAIIISRRKTPTATGQSARAQFWLDVGWGEEGDEICVRMAS